VPIDPPALSEEGISRSATGQRPAGSTVRWLSEALEPGGAMGDAMGRPNEGARSGEARERRVRDYQPWQGWQGGPKGITDGTQMTPTG
jgi:hypothetical protein